MITNATRAPRRSLNFKQRLAVAQLVSSDYVDSGLPDGEFADRLTFALGFTVVRAHVVHIRKSLDIANNESARRAALSSAVASDSLAALLARVGQIERQVSRLMTAYAEPSLLLPSIRAEAEVR